MQETPPIWWSKRLPITSILYIICRHMLEKYVFWNNQHNRYNRLIIDNQKNFQYRLINRLIVPALMQMYLTCQHVQVHVYTCLSLITCTCNCILLAYTHACTCISPCNYEYMYMYICVITGNRVLQTGTVSWTRWTHISRCYLRRPIHFVEQLTGLALWLVNIDWIWWVWPSNKYVGIR